MDHLRAVGVPYQINTTVARHNIHQMPETLALAKGLGAAALHLFLLVPVGCGMEITDDQQISPAEYERVLNWLRHAEMEGGIELKATCAPTTSGWCTAQAEERRQVLQSAQSMHRQQNAGGHPGGHPAQRIGGSANGDAAMRAVSKGCLAGTGVCFVSHRGEVASLWLPARRGRQHPPPALPGNLGRFGPLYPTPRNAQRLGGKCGVCEFTSLCGGCRARAYGTTLDYMGEEPFCSYEKTRRVRIQMEGVDL